MRFRKNFRKGKKTLAAYILAHGMEIAKYSTRSLAEVTYTSPPTVLRLCKKLGFTGFDDFNKILRVNWNISTSNRARWISIFPLLKTTAPCGWRQNIGELYEEAVKDTMQLLRYEDLHKAVLLLKYHEEIHIFPPGRPSIRPNPSEKRCSRSASGWSFSTI